MKQTEIKIPDSLPCPDCDAVMRPLDDSRMFVCSVWPIHTRFLTWRDLEEIARRQPKEPKAQKVARDPEPFTVNAADINWG